MSRKQLIITLVFAAANVCGHTQSIESYTSLSDSFWTAGQFDSALVYTYKAEPLIREKSGLNSSAYAYFFGQYFGINYEAGGHLDNAEYSYRHSDSLFKSAKDTISNEYGENITNLGNLCNKLGSYAEAIPMFEKALRVLDPRNGNARGAAKNNLANSYRYMGDYFMAEQIYQQLLDSIGPNSTAESLPAIAALNQNIGASAINRGDFEKAEQYFKKSVEILSKIAIKKQEYYEATLNLATVLIEEKKIQEAHLIYDSLYKKLSPDKNENYINYAAVAIGLGKTTQSADTAKMLFLEAISLTRKKEIKPTQYFAAHYNLAKNYMRQGNFTTADSILGRAMSDYNNQISHDEDTYQTIYNAYCQNLLQLQRFAEAKMHLQKLTLYVMKQLRTRLPGLDEFAQRQLIQHAQSHFDVLFSAVSQLPSDTRFINFSLGQLLQYKGIILTNQCRLYQMLRTSSDPQLAKLTLDWRTLKQRSISSLFTLVQQQEFESKAKMVERQLAAITGMSMEEYDSSIVDKIKRKLTGSEIAIEFVRYNEFSKKNLISRYYGAFIIKNKQPVTFVRLCNEDTLKRFLTLHQQFAPQQQTAVYWVKKNAVYNAIWKPIEAVVNKGCTIYYSADGALNYFSLNGIKTPAGSYLADDHALYALWSTRQLANRQREQPLAMNIGLWGKINEPIVLSSGTKAERPFTDYETRRIDSLFSANKMPVKVYAAAAASEENFKKTAGSFGDIIHLSVHGFYTPLKRVTANGNIDEPYENSILPNPLFRCGLHLDEYTNGKVNNDDGALTGSEIAQLDLSQTNLVVLSACMSGLGDVDAGSEGIWGMQRAFKIAGAKKLVMSLWKVKANATASLMVKFYTYLKDDPQHDPANALRAAQISMRRQHKNPHDWAGFVLIQ